MMKTCPRCGNRSDKEVCPICFTNMNPKVVLPNTPDAERFHYATAEEMRTLPPFVCPKCGGRILMISDRGRFCCASCKVMLNLPKAPVSPMPQPMVSNPAPQPKASEEPPVLSAPLPPMPEKVEDTPIVEVTHAEVEEEFSGSFMDKVREVAAEEEIDVNDTIPGFTLPDIEGEAPAAVEQEIKNMQERPQTPDMKPPVAEPAAPVKVKKPKKGFGKGGLIAVLCGIMALFLIGTCVAVAIEGFEKQESLFDEFTPSIPDTDGDTFSGYDDFFSDIPGFDDDFFSQFPGFDDGTSSSKPDTGEQFGKVEGDPFGDESLIPAYPNGCSSREFEKLEKGMNYGQISAIIGGDSSYFYDTTDENGEACTVFQWITENATGYISVKMIDGVADDFYAGEQ